MHRALLSTAIILCTALTMFSNASAQKATVTEADVVRIVLTETPVPSDLFAQSFLSQISATQVQQIRDQVTAPLGKFQSLEGGSGEYVAHYTHGTVKVLIHLDAKNQIDSLLLREPTVIGGSLDDARKRLDALPGTVSYLVLEDGKDIAARAADSPMGVGSSFKLAVLNALRKQIDGGKRHWSDVTHLQGAWKSLPSGVLQSWPDGTPLTLSTLATEMISISDNTAADSLIHIVGQPALATFAAGNVPFITTRQMFLLKMKGNEALRERFRTGNAAARRAVLADLDKQPLPDIAKLDTSPSLSDIEWHFSTRDLCKLIYGVHDLPLMSVNPGVASPSQWKRIAYKGGSDWGVLNFTTWLESKTGKHYCVSATWNNNAAQVDESTFASAYGALLGALATR